MADRGDDAGNVETVDYMKQKIFKAFFDKYHANAQRAAEQVAEDQRLRPKTYDDPTFEVDGVVHYCVANMPGAVPRTSTFALSNATLPFVVELANKGAKDAVESSDALASAANTLAGKLTCAPVAAAFEMEFSDPRAVSQGL